MTTRYASITKESELIKYYIKVKKKKMRSAKDYIWCVSYEPSEQHMEQKHQELSVLLHNRKINLLLIKEDFKGLLSPPELILQ